MVEFEWGMKKARVLNTYAAQARISKCDQTQLLDFALRLVAVYSKVAQSYYKVNPFGNTHRARAR